ncbi:Basic-leucine zipper domain [Dillenia turbinata]|uniref:Basic-leucine zipper domain n=1 Tax=Dillenia turbinata TaxID=194707 RepID=A0AAN8VKE7_9MAGN
MMADSDNGGEIGGSEELSAPGRDRKLVEMLRLGIGETSSGVSAVHPHPQLWENTSHGGGTVAQEAGKTSVGTLSQHSSDHITTPFGLGLGSSISTQPRTQTQRSKGDDIYRAKLRRLEANREASRKSRMKKVQYLAELERSVKILEAEVAVLTPQVAYHREQKNTLMLKNNTMREQIRAIATTSKLNDGQDRETIGLSPVQELEGTQMPSTRPIKIRLCLLVVVLEGKQYHAIPICFFAHGETPNEDDSDGKLDLLLDLLLLLQFSINFQSIPYSLSNCGWRNDIDEEYRVKGYGDSKAGFLQ